MMHWHQILPYEENDLAHIGEKCVVQLIHAYTQY